MLPLLLSLANAADQAEYNKTYGTQKPTAGQLAALNRCIQGWGEASPWTDASDQKVRVIATQVRVMGFGGSEPVDQLETDYPHADSSYPTSLPNAQRQLAGYSNEVRRLVMRGNAERVFDFAPADPPVLANRSRQ